VITLAIGAAVGAVLVVVAWSVTGMRVRHILSAALLGTALGAVLDYIFGDGLGWWYYVHHPYWEPDYYYLIYPAWAVCAITIVAVDRIVSRYTRNVFAIWVVSAWIAGTGNELLGLARDVWRYDVAFWGIALGWMCYVAVVATGERFVRVWGMTAGRRFRRALRRIEMTQNGKGAA